MNTKEPPLPPDDLSAIAMEREPRHQTHIVHLVENSLRRLEMPESVKTEIVSDLSDPYIWIDEEQIGKALIDLETNALDAMPEGGSLQIHIAGDDLQIEITIRDTGRGISREHMEEVFVPFFTTKPAGEGLGLGLPTVYAALRMHGGSIEVESNDNPEKGATGTTFRIALPRRKAVKPEFTRLFDHGED